MLLAVLGLVFLAMTSGCTIKVCGDSETQLQTGDGHMLETLSNTQEAEAEAVLDAPIK